MEDLPLTMESTSNKSANPTEAREEYKRKFQCVVCRVRFASKENLDSHKIIHNSDGVIKCPICEKQFDSVQGLMAHNVVHSKKKFKCELCDVWFKTSGNVKEHMKVHKGLVFKCSHCGKDFNKIGNLRLHEMRHTKTLKQFQCDLCPRIFSQKCLLKYHMRTHSGDRPYKCSACDSAFADKSNLRKHFRIHSGEKPFQCEQCDKSFNQKSSLTCHRRTHVTFKPFECQYCGKRFGLNEELIVHLRVHGENRKFKCSICDDEFVEHCYLKSHMRIHDMKTAGNKSVRIFKPDIDTEEPTCLISVNGDVNTLESIVLKKRKQNGRHGRRRQLNIENKDKKPNEKLKTRNHKEDSDSGRPEFQEDTEDSVPKCDGPQIFQQVANDVKTEIKEELNSIDDSAIPFVNVSIKVEPEDLTFTDQDNEHFSDHSNFDFVSQSFDSYDSDDDRPLIQPIDHKQRLDTQFGHNQRHPMDKFKHIIESTFPIVLVERLQYSEVKPTEITIKCEDNDDDQAGPDGIEDEQHSSFKETKNKKRKSTSDEQTLLYKCSYCSKELKTWANLIMHEQIHRKTLDCSTCKLPCSSIIELIKHSKENPNCSRKNEVSMTCSICENGVRYKTQAQLNYHMTKHTGLRPFICDICNKTFRSKETLRQHMNRHESVSNYNCEVCGRGFPNKNHLNQHQLSHTDEKPFRCDICNNFFKSQGRLYNHKKIHMKPQFSCCYCSKEFTIIGNLKIHEKRHMSSELVEKFECEICAKKFILKHDLKYHMRKHNGERPYPCSLCPSRFADISNLHKHVKIHTGDKPFVCHCGKSYNQQSSLNTHKKTHLVATLFETFLCTHCPKKFALEEDLTLHLRSHGVHSMFKCNFCDKEYELLNHMKSHRRIHLNLQLKRSKFLWPEKIDETSNIADNSETMKIDPDSYSNFNNKGRK